jgi:protein TonB
MRHRLIALWKSFTLLQVCLGVSVALHIGLLSFRLIDPEHFNRTFENTPFEVILVNAGSDAKPVKAQALAQHNLAGGGEAEKGRATSPLPPSPDSEIGDALEQTTRMVEQMQAEQQQLLSQVRKELSALPPPQPRAPATSPQTHAEEEHRRQLTKLLAELDKRIREENARPKKRYLSPATLKSADALYYSAFRTRVERAGTEHFPTQYGQKLYGELVMEVWLNRGGKVVDAIVTRSSGNKALDKRARNLVMAVAQFDPVPPEVSAGHDLLLISSRFRFTRDAGLETSTMQTSSTVTTLPTSPTAPFDPEHGTNP